MAEKEGVERVRFDIEDLLSQENLMDSGKVAELQDRLNKYVYGSDRLKVDGILGPNTLRGITQFRSESRYWGGHSTIEINPLKTYEGYLQGKGNK